MGAMTGQFSGQASRRSVAAIFTPGVPAHDDETWGPQKEVVSNLEILDPAGIEKIQQMTDPEGENVVVLSIAGLDQEPSHYAFKNFSGIKTATGLATDIVNRADSLDGNSNYGGVVELTADTLETYTAVPGTTVVDRDLVSFTRDVVAEMKSRYEQPRPAATVDHTA